MALLNFTCPHCKQAVQCDDAYSGQEVQCPTCQGGIQVPAPRRAEGSSRTFAPPPTGSEPKLSLGRQPGPASYVPPPTGKGAGPSRYVMGSKRKGEGAMKFVKIGGAVALLGVAAYFIYNYVRGTQEQSGEKPVAVAQNADAGQGGPGAKAPDAADTTGAAKRGAPGTRNPAAAGSEPAAAKAAEPKDLPLIPAVWTLDLETAKIPEGKLNGTISGTNFLADTVRVDPTTTSYVLRLTQGSLTSPDRELLVYLRLKAGEKLAGHSWTIAKDAKGTASPQVVKRWKTNPRYAPQQRSFYGGYAMKLELGQLGEGQIPGKIFLALPDAEQSVVAGVFTAATTVTDTTADATQAPAAAVAPAAAPAQSPAERAAFEKRYGIRR